jgi:hypothetical protein
MMVCFDLFLLVLQFLLFLLLFLLMLFLLSLLLLYLFWLNILLDNWRFDRVIFALVERFLLAHSDLQAPPAILLHWWRLGFLLGVCRFMPREGLSRQVLNRVVFLPLRIGVHLLVR